MIYILDNTLSNVKLNKTKLSPFECDYCDKILVDAKGLTLHTRLHTGEHLKHCGICNRGMFIVLYHFFYIRLTLCMCAGFAKMSHLNRHILTMHADGAQQQEDNDDNCNDDDEGVKEEPEEQSVVAPSTEHTVVDDKKSSSKKKYKCQFCAESFDERNELSVHIISHKEAPRFVFISACTQI